MRDIAKQLRHGEVFDVICFVHDVSAGTLRKWLSYAGYGVDGEPLQSEMPRQPLVSVAEGNCVTGGGGDYQGLPTEPVLSCHAHVGMPHTDFCQLTWPDGSLPLTFQLGQYLVRPQIDGGAALPVRRDGGDDPAAAPSSPRLFELIRHVDVTGQSGTGPIAAINRMQALCRGAAPACSTPASGSCRRAR